MPIPNVDHSAKESSDRRQVERHVERFEKLADPSSRCRAGRDHLAVEAPLELRIAGEPFVVVMRTPGNDAELARGLMFAEGLTELDTALFDIDVPAELSAAERGNVLELDIAGTPSKRNTLSWSSCGVCGKTSIADLEVRAPAVQSGLAVNAELIAELPERLRAAQSVFEATGGLHAAGAFDSRGVLLAAREDVGRHNAVDKLVGWGLGAGCVPAAEAILCVSGRLSFEIVQKAVVAGFPIVVAVSAPSSLAVDLAERFRVTLCGFTRGARFNVYSHASRIQ